LLTHFSISFKITSKTIPPPTTITNKSGRFQSDSVYLVTATLTGLALTLESTIGTELGGLSCLAVASQVRVSITAAKYFRNIVFFIIMLLFLF